jgi:hypothetical protein
MPQIKLTQDKYAVIDKIDLSLISKYKWNYHYGYASATINGKLVYMHRLILNAPKHLQVDHKNGILSDNRRSNIRLCTRSQNQMNIGKITEAVTKEFIGTKNGKNGE